MPAPSLSGFGLGLRAPHYAHALSGDHDVDWFEILTENYLDTHGPPREALEAIAQRYPVVMHGVSLSIGSTDPIDQDYLTRLKALAEHIQPRIISDHFCWTGIQGANTHDLLPIPLTQGALGHVIDRIQQVQDVLGRELVLENPSSYLDFTDSHIPEAEFIATVAERANCGLLLDVNNVYVNSRNHGFDARTYLATLPADRIRYMHLAGHQDFGSHVIDTHDHPVTDAVWKLYRLAIAQFGQIPTMIEWDTDIPRFDVLLDELQRARDCARQAEAPHQPTPAPQTRSHEDATPSPDINDAYLWLNQAILETDLRDADSRIKPSGTLTASEKLDIYVSGYRHRMADALSDEFPITRYYLGDATMDALIHAYVRDCPSVHYNLAHYQHGFVRFMQQLKQLTAHMPALAENNPALIAELVLLEANLSKAYDLPANNRTLSAALLANTPPESLEQLVLRLSSTVILHRYAYPVDQIADAYAEQLEISQPASETRWPEARWIACYRDGSRLKRVTLEEPEALILQAMDDGVPLGDALMNAAKASGISTESLVASLGHWLQRWTQMGLVQPDPTIHRQPRTESNAA